MHKTNIKENFIQKSLKIGIISLILLLMVIFSSAGIGVSFSYFLPRNGYFSHPVSPLSFRDIGVTFGKYIGVAGSLSLYSFEGMGIKNENNVLIDTGGTIVGPFHSVLGSLVMKIVIPIMSLEITGKGGLFRFYNINPVLMTGNLDRYIAAQEEYYTVNSSFTMDGKLGWGFVFGGNLTYYIQKKYGISLGAMYYIGGADMGLSGTYKYDGDNTADIPSYLQNVKLDYTGLELIIGGSYKM